MAEPDRKPRPPEEVFRVEAAAQRDLDRMIAESRDRLGNRCPECGEAGAPPTPMPVPVPAGQGDVS